jgi:hypothetical protein
MTDTTKKYIEFSSQFEHEIKFEKSSAMVCFDNVEFDKELKSCIATFIVVVYYENDEMIPIPITIMKGKYDHLENNKIYYVNYSLDLAKVKTLKVVISDRIPIRLYYHFERELNRELEGYVYKCPINESF